MGKLTIQSFAVMPFDENCYVVSDETGEGVVIDPGGMAKQILSYIREAKLSIKAVLDTHGHCDHIGANDEIRDETGAPLYIHKEDAAMISDMKLNLSAFMGFRVISRPGRRCSLLPCRRPFTLWDSRARLLAPLSSSWLFSPR